MVDKVPLPASLREFIFSSEWTFAKTYANTWPHEYIVRDQVNKNLFIQLVQHIRQNGHEEMFFQKQFIYFHESELVYWTIGAPVEETTIVNRCRKEQTFEYRLKNGVLPESDQDKE